MPMTITAVGDGNRTQFQLPVPVTATSDVTSVLVNGGAGPAVSSVAGDLVNLASAPAAGSTVAITIKDRRADEQMTFIETNDRPVLTRYTTASHTLEGTAIPGNIVDVFVGGSYSISTLTATDGSFLVVLPTFAGTQLITAVQRRPDPFHATTAVVDGYGISSTY